MADWPTLPKRRDELFVHVSGEHHDGEVAGLGVGHAQAINELALLAHLGQHAGQSSAAPVDHANG